MDIQSNVVLNKKEVLKIVLTNIFKLFNRRKLTDKSFTEKILKEFLEAKVFYADMETKLSVLFLDDDIKNISSGSVIDDYLNKNNEYRKFIICKSFSKKVYKLMNDVYKNAEIFFIHEFLEDIPSKKFIPNHEILSEEEKMDLLNTFKLNELSKIYKSDMMVRYYGGKVNDVFRIKRYNINSGISVLYRVVIEGTVDNLF
jgi:DNA-directed RNA polymerase subunit H (RpoH/RPB5)